MPEWAGFLIRVRLLGVWCQGVVWGLRAAQCLGEINWAGICGALSGNRPFPHVLCFCPSLEYLNNSEWVSESHSAASNSLWPHGLYSPWNSPGQNTGVDTFFRGSSQPRDQAQVSTLQADSLPAEPQGKPKNTGVGSLSLLQWIFPTQELNQDLLHCRWILYQLSSQGNPNNSIWCIFPELFYRC